VAEVASASDADAQGYVFVNGRRIRMISTKGLSAAKKPRVKSKVVAVEEARKPETVKTTLDRKALNHYRKLLLIKRAEIVGDVSAMEAQALRASDGNLSSMPIHMADIGTDTYDQDFMLGMAESERKVLREVEDALRRIDDKTYGVCQMTGQQIPTARLDAKPWAKYTVEAARQLENQWGS
jgi:RNA polymerase-binding protein DksA